MLIDVARCTLLVVDVQTRLLPAIDSHQEILQQVVWLIRLAKRLGLPIAASEQYPQGLGATHADVLAELPPNCVVSKNHFSCVAAGCLDNTREQWILCGIESHVCVLQTAIELKAAGREVFVVETAVGSRRTSDKAIALQRMRDAGIHIVSPEMVAFECLRTSEAPFFREISRDFLR
ncbi:MAG: isochorismatase family protein [Rhodocyclaceae bacterium]|nr:isochorismatase family protein [Rhodocyclaceae bacterium]MBK9625099.1 isochorismatase family protein [Rhodocyclaceae bacterium]MBL0077350.1 isochorismatase family protein [Rhodocyclaceae bacterium]